MTNNFTVSTTLVIACCMFMACSNHANKKVTKAFYYWKTNFTLTAFEQKKLDSFQCKTLYLHFFDIDWNDKTNEPGPVAINKIIQPLQNGVSCVPVIFITQDVLNKTPVNKLADLAGNFTKLLYQKCIQAKIKPVEIQIDCDWTVSNKDKYFVLLGLCRKQDFFKGKILSCTIRLHQVHTPKVAGIPPVDKGLLMCYNMGNLRLPGSNNSIIDVNVAERYLDNLQNYPLPLDIALPLFSWCLLYDDENRFAGILRDVRESDLSANNLFTALAKNMYAVKKDTLWRGYYLRRDEIVRYETSNTDDLYKLAGFVAAKMNSRPSSLIFYHCDSTVLSKYKNYELEKIYHFFN